MKNESADNWKVKSKRKRSMSTKKNKIKEAKSFNKKMYINITLIITNNLKEAIQENEKIKIKKRYR